jgi:hypothetical protein
MTDQAMHQTLGQPQNDHLPWGKFAGEAKAVFDLDVLRGDSLQVWHGMNFSSG